MSWSEISWFLPTAAIAALTLIAGLALMLQPRRRARKFWVVGVMVCGAALVGASAAQQELGRAALQDRDARLAKLQARPAEQATRLADIAKALPGGPGKSPEETLARTAAALRTLQAVMRDVGPLFRDEERQARDVGPAAAAAIAADLRHRGSHAVAVACLPDDAEGCAYAKQLADVLRAAGWTALGPDKTTRFGTAAPLGLRLFVRRGSGRSPTADALIDAFNRVAIPLDTGTLPGSGRPDTAFPGAATVALLVGRKP